MKSSGFIFPSENFSSFFYSFMHDFGSGSSEIKNDFVSGISRSFIFLVDFPIGSLVMIGSHFEFSDNFWGFGTPSSRFELFY